MPDESERHDGALELAAILGEAIARLHLAGRNANAPVGNDQGVYTYISLTEGEVPEHEDYNTRGFEAAEGH